jgi:LEA14-like dessication related protein
MSIIGYQFKLAANIMKNPLLQTLALLFVFVLSGCAQLSKKADAIKPTAEVTNVRLANINFEQADLVFDLAVENRNPVALKLSGLNYNLKIENQSVVSGVAASGMQIKASSTSTVELPVSLKFDDLKKLPGELMNKDSIVYQLDTQFVVNLPVIGDMTIPVSKQGELPVPKLPRIKIKDVKIKKLGFTEANIVAQVEIDNPNAFDLGLSDMNYKLNINQQTWGQGKISQSSSIPKKGKGTIDIPVTLNLLSMGPAVYTLLSKKQAFEYHLVGGVTLDTGIELLRNYTMPLDIKGKSALQ